MVTWDHQRTHHGLTHQSEERSSLAPQTATDVNKTLRVAMNDCNWLSFLPFIAYLYAFLFFLRSFLMILDSLPHLNSKVQWCSNVTKGHWGHSAGLIHHRLSPRSLTVNTTGIGGIHRGESVQNESDGFTVTVWIKKSIRVPFSSVECIRVSFSSVGILTLLNYTLNIIEPPMIQRISGGSWPRGNGNPIPKFWTVV